MVVGATHDDADVIVVGAGPAGSAAAFHCASAGLDVLLLEKSEFPRDKVCGDGLTPRAVAELVRMGLPIREQDGWIRNVGLRVHRRRSPPRARVAGAVQLPVVRAREVADVARPHARGPRARRGRQAAGAHHRHGTGARRALGPGGRACTPRSTARPVTYRAPVVIAADGVSARLATGMGLEKRMDRPMGVAVRTYFRTPRHDDPWMESHLELCDGENNLMPGYGWIFSLGDGTANVGLGLGGLDGRGDEGRLQEAVRHVDGQRARRVGVHARQPGGTRQGCRAADGLQPRTALRQRPDARRATPPG